MSHYSIFNTRPITTQSNTTQSNTLQYNTLQSNTNNTTHSKSNNTTHSNTTQSNTLQSNTTHSNTLQSNVTRKDSKKRQPTGQILTQPPSIAQRGSSNSKEIFNLPPKKIIKATENYNGKRIGELSFHKGDFFYVIHDKPEEMVYEVMNPIEKTRGLVHYCYFQNVARNAAEANTVEADPDPVRVSLDFWAPNEEGPPSPYDRESEGRYDKPISPGYEPRTFRDDNEDYYDDVFQDPKPLHEQISPSDYPTQQYTPRPLYNSPPLKAKSKPSDIATMQVQSCSLQNGKWFFILHIQYHSRKLDVITRSYDDIWALQVNILTRFPTEAGHNGYARVIPFLLPPQADPNIRQTAETKREINRFFAEMGYLPSVILQSSHLLSFFKIRNGDERDAAITTDVSDTLLDLLDDIENLPLITVKLILGEEVVIWTEEPGLEFDELMYQCEDRLGFAIDRLVYLDEVDTMTVLVGDEDLRLLLSSSPLLLFYMN